MIERTRNWIGVALVALALLAAGCASAEPESRDRPMNEVDGVLQGPS